MEIFKLLSITLGAILANNFIFSQFLGCCPFLGVSKKVDTAVGMGGSSSIRCPSTSPRSATTGTISSTKRQSTSSTSPGSSRKMNSSAPVHGS